MTAPQTTWATTDDVLTYTGYEVDAQQLTVAAGTIDMFSNRTYALDAAKTGARDTYWLKLAVCYQAAWLAEQPDAFTRFDIEILGQVRARTQFASGAMVLGPFARQALKRVSWLKSRSLHVRSTFQDGTSPLSYDVYSTASDNAYGWDPLDGG